MIGARTFHQVIGGRPIAMAIEQRSDDPAVQNAGERFIFQFRFPFRDDFIPVEKTTNVQAIRIRRATTKARVGWRVFFLERLELFHCVAN